MAFAMASTFSISLYVGITTKALFIVVELCHTLAIGKAGELLSDRSRAFLTLRKRAVHVMLLEIRNYGDPVLREAGTVFEQVDDEVRELAENMLETMREEQGVGLAAQQIGLALMICVVHVASEYDLDDAGIRENSDIEMPLVLINPEILSVSDETWTMEEGCLSFPGISASITRPRGIRLRYLDAMGQIHEVEAQGFLARVIQHEVDHLNGVLFLDHMSHVKKVALSGRLKRMKKETQQHLGLA